jgi:hypothetical protein
VKFLKGLLLGLGAVLIVATIVLVVWDVIQINHLAEVAEANRSAQAAVAANPRAWVLLGAAGALIGGFVLGCGVALPRRTFRQRLQSEADQRLRAPTGPTTPPA